MRPEMRFVLAVVLMIGVFVGTNMLFPPATPDPAPGADDAGAGEETRGGEAGDRQMEPPAAPAADDPPSAAVPSLPAEDRESLVTVETPLYRMSFSNYGGVARAIELLQYESFAREGYVDLVPEGGAVLGGELRLPGQDPVDLTRFSHTVTPAEGLRIGGGSGPRTLTFRYDHPRGFFSEIRYTFSADSYLVEVEGDLPPFDRAALFIDLGTGIASNERRPRDERRMINFVGNPVNDGIRSRSMLRFREPETIDGPLHWAAVKSKYFAEVVLPAAGPDAGGFLSGLWAEPSDLGDRAAVTVGTPLSSGGSYAYRAYLGPIERDRLLAIGQNLEEINPYGWAFFRPIIKPLVEPLLWLVEYMHVSLRLGYGWVLIAIGVLLRLVLWPLNRRAMRSQVKTMAVAPLAQEIKEKYGKDPQRMQQETIKLYKEHGVNPMAGCLPLLIPMPIFIALFFVFQNTIELRGVPFMWLPDLSARDPYYILPIFCGLSMYLLQRISMRVTQGAVNPQMKMMMYFMPIFMTVILWTFPSGLNLYYAAVNVAMLPQQILIANERKKLQATGPARRPA